MSGLLVLSNEDFSVQRGTKGDIMCHSIDGFSLILFYSTNCTHCQSLIPIFKKLPGSINGCQFGLINISTKANKPVVAKAANTLSPIKFVPYIVLYINGKPFMRYQGNYNDADIRKFVWDVARNIKMKQKFVIFNYLSCRFVYSQILVITFAMLA